MATCSSYEVVCILYVPMEFQLNFLFLLLCFVDEEDQDMFEVMA